MKDSSPAMQKFLSLKSQPYICLHQTASWDLTDHTCRGTATVPYQTLLKQHRKRWSFWYLTNNMLDLAIRFGDNTNRHYLVFVITNRTLLTRPTSETCSLFQFIHWDKMKKIKIWKEKHHQNLELSIVTRQ